MFNPMLATVLLGGCKGNTTLEHITIYWIGASVGAILAFLVYPKFKTFAYPPKQTMSSKTKDNFATSNGEKKEKSS